MTKRDRTLSGMLVLLLMVGLVAGCKSETQGPNGAQLSGEPGMPGPDLPTDPGNPLPPGMTQPPVRPLDPVNPLDEVAVQPTPVTQPAPAVDPVPVTAPVPTDITRDVAAENPGPISQVDPVAEQTPSVDDSTASEQPPAQSDGLPYAETPVVDVGISTPDTPQISPEVTPEITPEVTPSVVSNPTPVLSGAALQPLVTPLVPNTDETGEIFEYNPQTLTCDDSDGQDGLNQSQLTECGGMSGERVRDSNLSAQNLSGVDLQNATLINVNLDEADLQGADLSGSTISNTSFLRTNIEDAEFDGAVVENSDLRDYEVLSRMLESGAVLQLNNELPRVIQQTEDVLKSEFDLVAAVPSSLDDPGDLTAVKPNVDSPPDMNDRLGELKKRAERIRRDVAELHARIDKNIMELKPKRADLAKIKKTRDEQREKIRGLKEKIAALKADSKQTIDERQRLNREIRRVKTALIECKKCDQRDDLKKELKGLQRKRTDLAHETRNDRRKKLKSIPEFVEARSEIERLVDSVKDVRGDIKEIQSKNNELRETLIVKMRELKQLRKQATRLLATM